MSTETKGNRGSAQAGNSADGGLRRALTNRHIQMIALGGAIGTGLFYGSAAGIKLAGPSILLAYALGGAVIFFVVRAMGEMSVHRPSSGSFSRYANDYWSPRAGFVAGWNYWFNYIAVAMAELTVVGQYVQYWFPSVPAWASAAAVLLVITAVNLVGVKAFGEFEFWFSAIKVAAVVGMIVLGLYVIAAGVNSNPHLPDPSFGHLFGDGFLAKGVTGLLASLVFVMFSFGGIELIGITAGEAENPQRSIPKAVNQVVYRILIFYIGALFVVMAVVPWDAIDGKLSPFVQIFDSVGIKAAAHMLNFVVLTAALSVYNSGLYSNGRMLYSLAWQGNAPKAFTKLSHRGIPYVGVLFSSLVTATAVAIVYFLPETAFTIVISTALASGDHILGHHFDHSEEVQESHRTPGRGGAFIQAPGRQNDELNCSRRAGRAPCAHGLQRRLPNGGNRPPNLARHSIRRLRGRTAEERARRAGPEGRPGRTSPVRRRRRVGAPKDMRNR